MKGFVKLSSEEKDTLSKPIEDKPESQKNKHSSEEEFEVITFLDKDQDIEPVKS